MPLPGHGEVLGDRAEDGLLEWDEWPAGGQRARQPVAVPVPTLAAAVKKGTVSSDLPKNRELLPAPRCFIDELMTSQAVSAAWSSER